MNPAVSDHQNPCDQVSNPEAEEVVGGWVATIHAVSDPALLSRVMQKLMQQAVVVESLRFDAELAKRTARIQLHFLATEERARLLVRRWQTIVTVVSVGLVSICR